MARLALLLCVTAAIAGPTFAGQPADPVHRAPAPDALLSRIAVGSCLNQRRPAPILRTIAGLHPDLLLLIGDNVYADTDNPARMRGAYADLAANADYRALVAAVPVLATWDDHDYGDNDAGAEWGFKRGAKDAMLAFFDEPLDSPRRGREGVYDARVFGPPGRRVQVILLDTRWFRSPLVQAEKGYAPNADPQATLLGAAQWAWLESQLREPAELRILGSSIQVVANDHGFERWGNFPAERARLLRTLAATGARDVVVVSGDRHRGELSVLDDPALGYPLYDLTASSLNVPIPRDEPNRLRRGPLVTVANFGLIEIDWNATPPALTLSLRGEDGAAIVQERVSFDRLRPRPGG
jgi:alkaline phosphatase D